VKQFYGPSPDDVERAKARGMDPWDYARWRHELKARYAELTPPPRLTESNCMLRPCGVVREWMVSDIAPSIKLGEPPRVL
jgi:hypothetical protein